MKTAKEICKAIESLFGDTKQSPKKTLSDLTDIYEKAEMYIDALRSDGVKL